MPNTSFRELRYGVFNPALELEPELDFVWARFCSSSGDPVTDRQPCSTRETVAEGLRAASALVAVVLLARLQVGAFARAPTVGVAGLVGIVAWIAAVLATHWSRPTGASLLRHWRDGVVPTLITLVVGGRGSAPLLLTEMAIMTLGVIALGYVAIRQSTVCCVPLGGREPAATPRAAAAEAEAGTVGVPSTEPADSRGFEASAESSPLAAIAVGSVQDGIATNWEPTPHSVPTGLELQGDEPVEEANQDAPVESWTRRESDGDVSIEAVIHARFAEGSKLAVVHLPFVPPLSAIPQIESEPLDADCDIAITTEAAYRHGAKLSITRPVAGPAESVPIGVMVYTTAAEAIES